jgi:hypothetical protein
MPKVTHEFLVTILRNDPTLLLDQLWPDRLFPPRSIHIGHEQFADLGCYGP